METLSSQPDSQRSNGSGGYRSYLWAGLVVIVLVIGFFARRRAPTGAATGDCGVHASASIVTRDAPTSRALNITTDMLMLKNEDGDTWKDVEVTASGYQRLGTQGRQPSGAYALPPDKLHDKGGLYAIQMNDFEKVDGGSRWVSLTMTADVINVKATVNGKSCGVDVTPSSR
jgi:hypothetical protein